MPFSRSRIRDRMDAGEIHIEPFAEDHLTPNGYDLSLSGEVHRMTDIGRPVNPLNRESLGAFLAEPEEASGEIRLEPFEPVSVRSREAVGIDPSVMAKIEGRSSVGKMGVFVHCNAGVVDAGFGSEDPQPVVFTLLSCNPNPVTLHPGQPVAQLQFYDVADPPEGPTRYASYETAVAPSFDGLVADLSDGPFFVGITGLPAAGKSVVAGMLSELLDAEIHSLGEVVREEARRRGLEPDSENLRDVSMDLREERGKAAVAELLVEQLEDLDADRPGIVEGIRSREEIEVFRDQLPARFVTVGVHSSERTRLRRMKERERSDDQPTEEYLSNRDEKETRFGVREAITSSDHVITNEGTEAELQREVEATLARILRGRT